MIRKRDKYQEPAERKMRPMLVQQIENEREVIALNALFGNVDDGADILWPGAFAKTLMERFHRVRVLWQHNHTLPPIGVPRWAREITREDLPEKVRADHPDASGGLLTKIEYLDTERGNEVLTGIRAGAINENSFGYDPIVFDFEEKGGRQIRNLREVRLWDLSPVNWGMNEGAVILGFKMVDVTDTYIRIRIFDPEECQRNSFRTITLDADKGIQAVICKREEEETTSIQSVLFDKNKWTVDEAQRWVEEHDLSSLPKVLLQAGLLSLSAVAGPTAVKFVGSPRNPFGTHSSYMFKGGREGYQAAWRCHFSRVGGGALTAEATGPIRGTVRRVAMIAAALKPACKLISTDDVEPRSGPKSPLKCSFPEKPSDYGLSQWREPESDEDREGIKLSCWDLNVIKRAALSEIKRRARDREEQEGGKSALPRVALLALAEELRSEMALGTLEQFVAFVVEELKTGRALADNQILLRDAIWQMQNAISVLSAILDEPRTGEPGNEGSPLAGNSLAMQWRLKLLELQNTLQRR